MCPLWFYATTFWTFKYHLSLFETHLLNIFFGCIASWSRTLYLERKVEISEWIELRVKLLKFIYSEKATKFCEIFTLLLTVCTAVKIR